MGFTRSNIQLLCALSTCLLLLIFCGRLWQIGPTHTDDAQWHLAAMQGNWGVVNQWATMQGRFFAYVSGSLIYIGNMFQGSHWGSILQFASFSSFFLLFHYVIAKRFSSIIALLAACLNLALFSLRWDGSIVTTYPLYFWVLGSFFLLALILGQTYLHSGRKSSLAAYAVLLFVSLNVHEGASVLLAGLAVIACLCCFSLPQRKWRGTGMAKAKTLVKEFLASGSRYEKNYFLTTMVVVAGYFMCFAAFRLAFPTQYSGNSLGSLSPFSVLPLLFNLSLNGNAFGELLGPYRVGFSDTLAGDGYGIAYRFTKYAFGSGTSLIASVTATIVFLQLAGLMYLCRKDDSTELLQKQRMLCLLGIGLLIAIIPVAPVALAGKYQEHFWTLGVSAHCYTPLCHFGWSLLLAGAVWWTNSNLPGPRSRIVSASGFTVLITFFAYGVAKRNDSVAADMRRETCRWQVAQRVESLLESIDSPVQSLCIPQFASGTWFTVVPSSYWESYFSARFGREVKFCEGPITQQDIESGIMLVQYEPASVSYETWVMGAILNSDGPVLEAKEVAISIEGLAPAKYNRLKLSYKNQKNELVSQRISQLQTASTNHSTKILQNANAIVESVKVSEETLVAQVPLQPDVLGKQPVHFGTPHFGRLERFFANHWLQKDEWHPPEQHGVWSKIEASRLTVPITEAQPERIKLRLSTLTGLGHCDISQQVKISISGGTPTLLEFEAGQGFKDAIISLDDYTSSKSFIDVDILVQPLLCPKEMGLSADQRKLGAIVRSIEICEPENDTLELAERRPPKPTR